MKPPLTVYRTLPFLLVPACVFLLFGSLGSIAEVEAASASASARIIKKLKKQIATLKKQLAAATAVSPTPAPFIEMVKVGNVGNAADQDFGDGQFGAVPYEYSIGKYEVTLAQYTDFLNAVAATDTHALYTTNLQTDPNIAGIARSGNSGSYSYSVIGTGTRPVTYVTWFSAARFCNWLHHGRPTGAQDATTTENGAYPLNGAISGGLTITRNPGAKFWIPSENEWYKAAYHQPSGDGGDVDDYWFYPTRSNTPPASDVPPGGGNSANFNSPALTSVGAYTGSASFYGTFDQGGNVFEWNDGVYYGTSRGKRGGSRSSLENGLRSDYRSDDNPVNQQASVGFRIASP